jgi:hypothetical protein
MNPFLAPFDAEHNTNKKPPPPDGMNPFLAPFDAELRRIKGQKVNPFDVMREVLGAAGESDAVSADIHYIQKMMSTNTKNNQQLDSSSSIPGGSGIGGSSDTTPMFSDFYQSSVWTGVISLWAMERQSTVSYERGMDMCCQLYQTWHTCAATQCGKFNLNGNTFFDYKTSDLYKDVCLTDWIDGVGQNPTEMKGIDEIEDYYESWREEERLNIIRKLAKIAEGGRRLTGDAGDADAGSGSADSRVSGRLSNSRISDGSTSSKPLSARALAATIPENQPYKRKFDIDSKFGNNSPDYWLQNSHTVLKEDDNAKPVPQMAFHGLSLKKTFGEENEKLDNTPDWGSKLQS